MQKNAFPGARSTFVAALAAAVAFAAPARADEAAPPAVAAPVVAADAPAPAPKAGKFRPRISDWEVKGAIALNTGTFVGYWNFGAPFLGIGVMTGIARRFNVGVSLQSVYTLRNTPQLDLKLTLLGPRKCAETVGGGSGSYCTTKHALAIAVSAGYMLGGTTRRTLTYTNGETRYRLSGLPTWIDDTNHLRITPALVYSYSGGPFLAFTRAQVLIQKFLEDDPTGAPRDKINILPEAVAGFEVGAGTRLHFWLEGGVGPYVDWNFPVEGMPMETTRHIGMAGHVEAGLALYIY